MHSIRALAPIAVAALVLASSPMLSGSPAQAGRFVPSADGLTVKDTVLHVTWAADLNLPASLPFGLAVHGSGSMTYQVVRRWIAALNASGYAGRRDWTIPAMPATDATCSVAKGPNGNSFGFDCTNNPMGSLYSRGLGVRQPNTAVPMPPNRVGPFRNFQPYFYWSANGKERADAGRGADRRANRQNGDHAFSFNTGWQGGNVSDHVMYVLPMIRGPLAGAKRTGTDLQPSADGQTVYDPIADVTWLANANLAAETTFGVTGIVKDGAMTRVVADDFIDAMNRYQRSGYLGQNHWQLPPTDPDPSCTLKDGGYNCSGSPMGALYHRHLLKIAGRAAGEPIVQPPPDTRVGPFHNLMPYLYWGCAGQAGSLGCSGEPAATGFQFSFSFGNGFTGTDVVGNSLYVMVYAIDGR